MRKWWSRLKRRLEGVSRRDQTVFYLIWSVFLIFGIWLRMGYPLPTAELEFRRMERQNLLPRSEIVFNSEKDCPLRWRELPELDFGYYDDVMVGAGDRYACIYGPEYNIVRTYHLAEGAVPVPMYDITAHWMPLPGFIEYGTPLLFLQVPEEADRALVEIEAEDHEGRELRYQGEGWRLAPGRWMFAAAPGDSFSGDWYAGGRYTLTLYRKDGSLLLEKSGTLPEE